MLPRTSLPSSCSFTLAASAVSAIIRPVAANLLSINCFICERVLVEQDDVTSAIRIADTVNLVEDGSGQLSVVVMAKTKESTPGTWTARVFMVEPSGSESEIFGKPIVIQHEGAGDRPFTSVTFVPTFSVGPNTKVGINWFRLLLNNEEAIRLPFTVNRTTAGETAKLQTSE